VVGRAFIRGIAEAYNFNANQTWRKKRMKRVGCILALIFISVPAWPAKKITVAELTDLLKSLQEQKKSDADTALALKQVQLNEQLTRGTMNNLAGYAAGPLTTEQIYVLEAGSAVLAPPPSDLPSTPALDAAAQKVLLDKAADYVAKTYSQLPAFTAAKITVRFQDNIEAPQSSSGMVGSARDNSVGSGFVSPMQYVRYIGSTESRIESNNGIEKPLVKEKGSRWGANGQIAMFGQEPALPTVLREAQDSGGLTWVRWESIDGKPAAVFSFAVQKKKSHYAVDYCCFPDVSQAGIAQFSSAALAGAQGGGSGGGKGNFQTATDWHDFKVNGLPYHGALYIDPDTGIVVRMITIADFKNSDVVHQEDQRFDYGPVTVGDKTLVVPLRKLINTEAVPTGESGSAGKYTTRRTMLTAEYKDFQLAK
jgi:hypothetical protein